jgi:pimeloyl-ACP methyl ester carboxylesterase
VTNGVELHTVWDVVDGVRVRGRVNDRALADHPGAPHAVFVHGLGMATDYLEPTMRLLGIEMAVSALDLPGFGGSRLTLSVTPSERNESSVIPSERSESRDPHLKVGLTVGELAAALTSWLGIRGIIAPILVGQSHGCQVIIEAVSRNRGLASALVLNAPTMLAGHRSILGQLWRVALDTPREPLSLVPHVARDYLRAGPLRILATLRHALRDRVEEKLPEIRVPVTIVTGARDPVSPPAWCERLARLTGTRAGGSGARLVVVPDAAHAVPFSHPSALAAEIVAMIERVGSLRRSR